MTAVRQASDALVRSLLDTRLYPHPVDAVELVETHISWILLAGAYVYKIKKPVDLGFLDFSTLERRRFCCDEELRLNRRLAPELYLDVVPVGGTPEKPVLGEQPAIEYAVRMARFPQEGLLDRMLAAGELLPRQVDEVAREVARFHAAIAGAAVPRGLGTPEAVHRPVVENFPPLLQALSGRAEGASLPALRAWSEAESVRLRADFEARLEQGFVRECHGDLHLGNMALVDGRVTLFDCIEFNPGLRWIDVMNDAAFVVMDLADRGRMDLARRFLDVYLQQGGDFGGLRVLRYYLVYRAMVRAKVACIRATQAGDEARATAARHAASAYLALAERFTRPARPWLLITHGYSGSGKSLAAQALLEQSDAVRLRSDVERKRLSGLAPEAQSHSGVGTGLYAPDGHVRTYRRLEELAREVLRAGFPVIVDAAFLRRGEREAFRALARELAVPFTVLDLVAPEDVLRQRIAERAQAGRDPSEATVAVLENQIRHAEPVGTEERPWTVTLESGPALDAGLRALAARLMD